MATINAEAIIAAIEQRALGLLTDYRDIATGTYQTDAYEGMPDGASAMRALVRPTVDVEITGMRRHPQSPPDVHSLALLEVDVRVTVTRATDAASKLDAATRRALKGAAVRDGDVLRQALSVPGVLETTTASTATGIVSGLLIYVDSDVSTRFDGEENARVVGVHRFHGVVRVTQETA